MTHPTDLHGTLQIVWKEFGPIDAGEYKVTFEGYSDDHLGKRPRIFDTREAFIQFLQFDVSVSIEAIERVLSDLARVGTAEIFDVELAAGDLTRLGFE